MAMTAADRAVVERVAPMVRRGLVGVLVKLRSKESAVPDAMKYAEESYSKHPDIRGARERFIDYLTDVYDYEILGVPSFIEEFWARIGPRLWNEFDGAGKCLAMPKRSRKKRPRDSDDSEDDMSKKRRKVR